MPRFALICLHMMLPGSPLGSLRPLCPLLSFGPFVSLCVSCVPFGVGVPWHVLVLCVPWCLVSFGVLCPFVSLVSLYVSSLSFPGNCSKLNFPPDKGFDNIHQSKPDYIAKFPNFTIPMYSIVQIIKWSNKLI